MSFFGRIFSSPAVKNATLLATAAGGAVVGAYNPGLGALVEMVGNACYTVETEAGNASTGAQKKAAAKAIIDVSAPVTLQVIKSITGKELAEPTSIAANLDALIDNVVALFHSIGVFAPKTTPAAAPAPAPAETTPSH